MGLKDRQGRHDRFFQRARAEGYAARSVFKLEELDGKFRLFAPGNRVLDLGCRPGSWLQYLIGRVGRHGHVVGIDRDPLPEPIPGARVLVGDIHETDDAMLLGELQAFDAVVSDMAPDTTGVRTTDQARSARLVEEALTRAERLLAPGGVFVAKIFEGPDVNVLRARMRKMFATVNTLKPEGTRRQSAETYLVGKGFSSI